MNLIIEGLTGAGKSSLIAELVKRSPAKWEVVYEDETLGELLAELTDKETSDHEKCFRLRNVLEKMASAHSNKCFLLERFHPSYYAMLPDWSLYAEMDHLLAQKDFLLVLLRYHESLFAERAIRRKNDDRTSSAVSYWGSFENAIEACKRSQDRRMECLKLTAMPHLMIDTSDMEWEKYAALL